MIGKYFEKILEWILNHMIEQSLPAQHPPDATGTFFTVFSSLNYLLFWAAAAFKSSSIFSSNLAFSIETAAVLSTF